MGFGFRDPGNAEGTDAAIVDAAIGIEGLGSIGFNCSFALRCYSLLGVVLCWAAAAVVARPPAYRTFWSLATTFAAASASFGNGHTSEEDILVGMILRVYRHEADTEGTDKGVPNRVPVWACTS